MSQVSPGCLSPPALPTLGPQASPLPSSAGPLLNAPTPGAGVWTFFPFWALASTYHHLQGRGLEASGRRASGLRAAFPVSQVLPTLRDKEVCRQV